MSALPPKADMRMRVRSSDLASSLPKDAWIELEAGRRIRPGMQVPARRGHVRMAERRLDFDQGRTTIQSVRAMGMT